MTRPFWVSETAEAFWAAAGKPGSPPRDLRTAILCTLPVAIVLLPRLRVGAVDDWLRQRGVACSAGAGDRTLRAGLVARDGHGFLFLDGGDPDDEQRFSLAHELAHFLRDYWQPRQRVAERLGAAALEVLDGVRPPEPAEQIHALLARTDLSYQVHLMDRSLDGGYRSAATERSERAADQLAYELLAPEAEIRGALGSSVPEERRARGADLLSVDYGLPPRHAARYAEVLFPPPAVGPLLRRLRDFS